MIDKKVNDLIKEWRVEATVHVVYAVHRQGKTCEPIRSKENTTVSINNKSWVGRVRFSRHECHESGVSPCREKRE